MKRVFVTIMLFVLFMSACNPAAVSSQSAEPSPVVPSPVLPTLASSTLVNDSALPAGFFAGETNAEALIGEILISKTLNTDLQATQPASSFDSPLTELYAIFAYDRMKASNQWSMLWYRLVENSPREMICYESAPWQGGTGGHGYSTCVLPPERWLPGEYEVQIFVGPDLKSSQRFSVREAAEVTKNPVPEKDSLQQGTEVDLDKAGSKVFSTTVERVKQLALSPDGSRVGVIDEKSLTIYDTKEFKVQLIFPQTIPFGRMIWSPDGKEMITTDRRGNKVVVWDVATMEERIGEKLVDGYSLQVVAWSPDGKYIVANPYSGVVSIWDADSLNRVTEVDIQGNRFNGAFSPDGRYLGVSSPGNKQLLIISTKDWAVVDRQPLMEAGILHWSPDGQLLAVVDGNSVAVYDNLRNYLVLHSDLGNQNQIISLEWSPDGKILAVAQSNRIILWNYKNNQKKVITDPQNISCANWLTNNRLMIGTTNGLLQVLELGTRTAEEPAPSSAQSEMSGPAGETGTPTAVKPAQSSGLPEMSSPLKPVDSVYLRADFEDLSPQETGAGPLFLFENKKYGSIGAAPNLAGFGVKRLPDSGSTSINLVPNGNPATNQYSKVYNAMRLVPVLDVHGVSSVSLRFALFSNSNPHPAEVDGCASFVILYSRLDQGRWKHQIIYCGAYPGETNWEGTYFSIDTRGASTLELAFEYILQNSPVSNSDAFFLIDNIELKVEK